MLVVDNFTAGASTQDSSSLYLVGPGARSILKLSPPDASPTALSFDSSLQVRALAVDGVYVYAAVDDLSAQPGEGLIVRIPKTGGSTDRLTPLAGNPDRLAVDSGGLFWLQEPPPGTFGNTEILHSDLMGRNIATLFDGSAASASDVALGPADLYFIADGLERIGKNGGAVESLTTSLAGAGLLRVSGSDLVSGRQRQPRALIHGADHHRSDVRGPRPAPERFEGRLGKVQGAWTGQEPQPEHAGHLLCDFLRCRALAGAPVPRIFEPGMGSVEASFGTKGSTTRGLAFRT